MTDGHCPAATLALMLGIEHGLPVQPLRESRRAQAPSVPSLRPLLEVLQSLQRQRGREAIASPPRKTHKAARPCEAGLKRYSPADAGRQCCPEEYLSTRPRQSSSTRRHPAGSWWTVTHGPSAAPCGTEGDVCLTTNQDSKGHTLYIIWYVSAGAR